MHATSSHALYTGIDVPLEKLIDLRFKTQGMHLLSHKRVNTHYSGGHISSFKGRGIEFDEARIYQPGDDIRTIDWRVTARTGKTHTKVFKEERERPVYIIVDQSESMLFGTRVTLKSSIAAMAAALTAWTAISEGDRVGAFIFSGKDHYEFRPRARKYGVLPLLKTLSETTQPTPRTPDPKAFEKALDRLHYVLRPGSLVFIYSDFSLLTEKASLTLGALSQRCEIKAALISDRLEMHPPQDNIYPFSDGRQVIELDTRNAKEVKKYQDYFSRKHAIIKSTLTHYQIPLLQLTTESDVVKELQKAFIYWSTGNE